ncbi:MAG: ribulose-phosphate 3-epimerase, partial [Dehalococcoidia bacterium]|nr:ribulose-phosphate 3-epimerase [Dehalococcoidia bacterium]
IASIEEILPDIDLVLVMTVNPGFGGQSFIASVVGKIARLRQMLDERGLKAELEVDGGVGDQTAPLVVKAGANVLVAGSAVFNKKESVASAIARIRASVEGL